MDDNNRERGVSGLLSLPRALKPGGHAHHGFDDQAFFHPVELGHDGGVGKVPELAGVASEVVKLKLVGVTGTTNVDPALAGAGASDGHIFVEGVRPLPRVVKVAGVLPKLQLAGGLVWEVRNDRLNAARALDVVVGEVPANGDLRVALGDLVLRHEVNHVGVLARRGLRAGEDAGEVVADKVVHLQVGGGQLPKEGALVEAREAEHRGEEVNSAGDKVDIALWEPGGGDDERYVEGLLVGDCPLLEHVAMGAEDVAVVGGEDDDGVVEEAGGLEGEVNVADVLVDDLVEVVVDPAHLLARVEEVAVDLGRAVQVLKGVNILLLGTGLGAQVLLVTRAPGNVRHRVVPELQAHVLELGEEGDVVGVHQGRNYQEGLDLIFVRLGHPGAGSGPETKLLHPLLALLEVLADLLGEGGVALDPAILDFGAVGLGSYPVGEAKGVEWLAAEVLGLCLGDAPVVVVQSRDYLATRVSQVGMRDVPLPLLYAITEMRCEIKDQRSKTLQKDIRDVTGIVMATITVQKYFQVQFIRSCLSRKIGVSFSSFLVDDGSLFCSSSYLVDSLVSCRAKEVPHRGHRAWLQPPNAGVFCRLQVRKRKEKRRKKGSDKGLAIEERVCVENEEPTLANPKVSETPWMVLYCPVKRQALLGVQAVAAV